MVRGMLLLLVAETFVLALLVVVCTATCTNAFRRTSVGAGGIINGRPTTTQRSLLLLPLERTVQGGYGTKKPWRQQNGIHLARLNNKKGNDDDEDYQEFLQLKQRRAAVNACSTFDKNVLSPLDVERIIQVMETVHVPENKNILVQGDAADAMYFVASGAIECYDANSNNEQEDQEEEVKRTLTTGQAFGELALLSDDVRFLSFRAAAPNSSVWKLTKQHFAEVMQGAATKQAAISNLLEDNPYFVSYVEERNRRRTVQKCPLFQKLEDADIDHVVKAMKRVKVEKGQVLFTEGDRGDSMFFVVEGSFECYKNNRRENVLRCIIQEGGYFGELVRIFRKQRFVSVQAMEASVLWELTREDFNEAVQESFIDTEALELLKDAYDKDSFFKTLTKLTPDDVYDLLVAKSRPKKKPVSLHSQASVDTFTLFLGAFLSLWEPGIDPRDCLPQLFQVNGATNIITDRLTLASSLGFGVSGFMGVFRLPRRSKPMKKKLMETASTTSVFLALVLLSNLTGRDEATTWHLIDAFSVPGRTLLLASVAVTGYSYLGIIHEAITGPLKGREEIPLFGGRASGIAASILLYFLLFFLNIAILPLFGSREGFKAVQPVLEAQIPGAISTSSVAVQAFMGLGALLLTLLFEKRITPTRANTLSIMFGFLLMYDNIRLVAPFVSQADAVELAEMNAYYFQLFVDWLVPLSAAGLLGTVLNSVRKVVVDK